ncbi:ferredoxin-dependent bilin reductase-domain-containing protein [Ochromonadaceae sp. CCMP2298]|nr:ferredoxin-dependent bilin reductase-domain-containing protein [Ochromonadaceae sp. CCMP2298]
MMGNVVLLLLLLQVAHALLGVQPKRGIPSAGEALKNLDDTASKLLRQAVPAPAAATIEPTVYESDLPTPLPWSESLNPSRDLTYMPMFSKTLERLLEMGATQVELEPSTTQKLSDVKPARIGNMAFQTERFRKVRLTYFDAGDAVQVFNAVFYPAFQYDLPILGFDLISLGKSRVLNVMDFQPIHPTEEYSQRYIDPISHIRERYPDLQGKLSGKIYDDTSFFSKNMLFGRFGDESKVLDVVYPAFEEYLDAYLGMMQTAEADHDPDAMALVQARQSAYDAYSALKDPAVGLFDAYFGKQWSNSFVHDFLFSLSRDQTQNMASIGIPTAPHQPVHNFNVDKVSGVVTPASSGNTH